jgi:hypothetical protein
VQRPEPEGPTSAAPAEPGSGGPTGSVADRSQTEVEARLTEQGFAGQFGAREGARILCFTCHREFDAAMLDADRVRRIDGESDPADTSILVPVICPWCHTPGTLAIAFGPMASAEESEVIAALHRVPRSFDPVGGGNANGEPGR